MGEPGLYISVDCEHIAGVSSIELDDLTALCSMQSVGDEAMECGKMRSSCFSTSQRAVRTGWTCGM